jgi:hypothetical protein
MIPYIQYNLPSNSVVSRIQFLARAEPVFSGVVAYTNDKYFWGGKKIFKSRDRSPEFSV